jgi:hypothetical protein
MRELDPKAWAITSKLFRNMGAYLCARIVRVDVCMSGLGPCRAWCVMGFFILETPVLKAGKVGTLFLNPSLPNFNDCTQGCH